MYRMKIARPLPPSFPSLNAFTVLRKCAFIVALEALHYHPLTLAIPTVQPCLPYVLQKPGKTAKNVSISHSTQLFIPYIVLINIHHKSPSLLTINNAIPQRSN